MKQTNSKSPLSIDAILCGSERLYPWQRKFLEEVFQCKTYSWYGHTEKAVLAGECEQSTNYHIFPEYGYTEFISRNNNPLTGENEVGEVVATGFNNYAMPLIRYRTGDLATLANQPCSCGRNYPLLKKIEGRVLDFILSKSHRLIPLNIVYYDSIEKDISIKQFQFYQEKPGEVTLRIIKKQPYATKLTNTIIREMQKGLEGEVTFSIEYVENIQISKRGKSSLLIQKLPIQFGVDG
jgi:phenylacetate-CoA ligase